MWGQVLNVTRNLVREVRCPTSAQHQGAQKSCVEHRKVHHISLAALRST